MAFRKRNGRAWALRQRFVWSTGLILLYALVSLPDGPFGGFMSKGQTQSINELFQNELGTYTILCIIYYILLYCSSRTS